MKPTFCFWILRGPPCSTKQPKHDVVAHYYTERNHQDIGDLLILR
jgi:hypothetical protein